ncbi:MAG: hypothetical protein ACLUD1_06225 [Clostridia bacterium]
MKKIVYYVLVIVMLLVAVVALTGCNNENTQENTNNSEEQDVQEVQNVAVEADKNYKVTQEENEIVITYKHENIDITTTYLYQNNRLSQISIVQKYESADAAKIAYDLLEQEENMKQLYSKITLNGDTIRLDGSSSLIDSYKDLSKEDMYKKQKEIYGQQD